VPVPERPDSEEEEQQHVQDDAADADSPPHGSSFSPIAVVGPNLARLWL
jgi:hypothetical protein